MYKNKVENNFEVISAKKQKKNKNHISKNFFLHNSLSDYNPIHFFSSAIVNM